MIEVNKRRVLLADRELALTYVDDARSVQWYLLGYREGLWRDPIIPGNISEKPVDTKPSVPYSGA